MDVLATLFSSGAIVKIMRLFLFSPEDAYDAEDIATRAKVSKPSVRTETAILHKAGFLKKKQIFKEVSRGRGRSRKTMKKRASGWALDSKFPYLKALHQLLVNTELLSHRELLKKLSGTGRIKLIIVSGVFIQEPDSRIDLFVVGDNIKKKALDIAVRGIEAEIGTELRFAYFDTDEFEYRLGIYDRLVRDILDYPHVKILDKIGVV